MTDTLYNEFQNLLRGITPRFEKQRGHTWVAVEDPEHIDRTRVYYLQFESHGAVREGRLFSATMEEHECVLKIFTAYVDFYAHEIDPLCLDDNTDILETFSVAVNTQSIPGLTYIERDFPPGYTIDTVDDETESQSVHTVEHQFRFRYLRAR